MSNISFETAADGLSGVIKFAGVEVATVDSTGMVIPAGKSLTLGGAEQATPSGSAPLFSCRAWGHFNGVAGVSIGGSGNVASIVRNGTGDYSVTFATAMPDINYSVVANTSIDVGFSPQVIAMNAKSKGGYALEAPTINGFRFFVSRATDGLPVDQTYLHFAVFR